MGPIVSATERWARVRELLEQLHGASPERREALLAACEDDAVRLEVMDLLDEEAGLGSFLEAEGQGGAGFTLDAGGPHSQIDGFRVLRLLDSGGMGTVYLAEQDSPRREVALKLLRASLASTRAEQRFAHESEILGRLQHASIAHVYGSGTWVEGGQKLPWFAMEFVPEARYLQVYAQEQGLDLVARIRLFLEACEAVSYAHEKGVVHRDLKPSNLLVGEEGRLKVIDFGCAQFTGGQASLALTRTGEIMGTLAYMPPESLAEGARELDTRGDVYALGVILYELLVGRQPIDVSGSLHQAAERIRDQQPIRPSQLSPAVPVELDWIVLRAMAKERGRRYSSVEDLARDLRRFLDNRPVHARPPSRLYAIRKYVQRHRMQAGLICLVTLAILGWAVSSNVLYLDAVKAWNLEASQKRSLELAQEFFDESFFTADPSRLGPDVTMVEVVKSASERLKNRALPAQVAVSLHNSIGASLYGLGELRLAQANFARVLELAEGRELINPLDVYRAHMNLAYCHSDMLRTAEAEEHARLGYLGRLQVLGPDDPATSVAAVIYSSTLIALRRWDEVEALLDVSLPAAAESLGTGSKGYLDLISTRGALARAKGNMELAEADARQVVEGCEQLFTLMHPATIESIARVAQIVADRGRYEETYELMVQCLALREEVFGVDHPKTLTEASNIGGVLSYLGRNAEAEEVLRDVLDRMEEVLDPDSPLLWYTRNNLAQALDTLGQKEEAGEIMLAALEYTEDVIGVESEDFIRNLNNYARFLEKAGRSAEAVPYFERLGQLCEKLLPANSLLNATFRLNEARHLVDRGEYLRAEAPLRIVLTALKTQGSLEGAAGSTATRLLEEVLRVKAANASSSSSAAVVGDEP